MIPPMPRIAVTAVVALVLIAGACSSQGRRADKPSAVPRTFAAAIGSSQTVSVSDVTLNDEQERSLKEGWGDGVSIAIGRPVEVTTDQPLPRGGIRLTRTYPQALPRGFAATMAYYDETIGAWHAVPSQLAADRRSVTAVVHHLSLWTDFTGAVTSVGGAAGNAAGDVLSSVADWAYFEVGQVFDTRVDPPSCSGTAPDWVDTTTFIESNRNNPLLFCAGHDPEHPELLDVKARVNRGFGFNASINVPIAWTYNSTFRQLSINDAIHMVGNLDEALSAVLAQAAPAGGVLVGPGEELSMGVDKNAVTDAADPAVLTLSPPSTLGFLLSTLGTLVGKELELRADGYIAAAIAVSGCYSGIREADNPGSWTRAVLTCVGSLDEAAAKHLAVYLLRRGMSPQKAGKLAGKVIGKASIYLALIGPAFSAMNYAAERSLDPSARTVSVFPVPEPVSRRTLLTSEVPADCDLPAQRLVNGQTTQGGPGGGGIYRSAPHVSVDMAGLGYRQMLAVYSCSAGGVSWPAVLVLVGADGDLLGSLRLPGHSEHSDPRSFTVDGETATVAWDEYEGAGSFYVHHNSRLSYAGGKLVLDDDAAVYEPERVAEDVSVAAFTRRRNDLADRDVVTDEQWRELTSTELIGTTDGNSGCTVMGARATCLFDPAVSILIDPNPPPNVITLQRASGTTYGWTVVDVEIPSPST
jgi:hypothetical protein